MRIQEIRNAVRVDLGAQVGDLSDNEVERAVQKAVGDLSLRLPRPGIMDITVRLTVTAEALVSGTAPGKWVQLVSKPIQPETETLTDALGTVTYTRDVDYDMDYANGRVTHLAGGLITNAQALLVSYTRLGTTIDLGQLNGSMYRVRRVAYVAGTVPETTLDFRVEGHLLELGAGSDTQARVAEGRHLWVYYDGPHDAPTGLAPGTYPGNFDELVIKGASLYCLLQLAGRHYLKAGADLEAARLRLSVAETIHAEIGLVRGRVLTMQTQLGTTLGDVAGQIGEADAALNRVNALVSTATGVLGIATSQAGGSVLGRAEVELAASTTLITAALADLDRVVAWQDTGSDSARALLVTAVTNAGAVTGDLADAKTALDAAVTPLGDASTIITGDVDNDLALASSTLSGALTSVTTASTVAQAADDNLGNVGTVLSQAEMSSAVSIANQAAADADTAKAEGGAVGSLANVTALLDSGSGAVRSLANSAGEYTAAGTALGLANTAGDAAATALSRVQAATLAAETAVGEAKIHNDAGNSFASLATTEIGTAESAAGSAQTLAGQDLGDSMVDMDQYLGAAKTALDKLTNGLANVATNIFVAQNFWSSFTAGKANASELYLTSGDDLINQLNTGKDVPENYVRFSAAQLEVVKAYLEEEKILLEAVQRDLALNETWIKEAEQRTGQAAVRVRMLESIGGSARVVADAAGAKVGAAQAAVGGLSAKVNQAQAAVGMAQARVEAARNHVQEGAARVQLVNAYIESAKTRIQVLASYQEEAKTKVEVARLWVQDATTRVGIMNAKMGAAQAKAQLVDGLGRIAGYRADMARSWTMEAEARNGVGRNLVEVAKTHGEMVQAQVGVATQRVAAASVLVGAGQQRVGVAGGLLDRAGQRIGQVRVMVEAAQQRIAGAGQYNQSGATRIQAALVRVQAAERWLAESSALVQAAERYLAACRCHTEEAGVRLTGAQVMVQEAQARSGVVDNYLKEVGQLNQEIQNLVTEAQGYQQGSQQAVGLSKELQASGDSRRAEYVDLLKSVTLLQPDTGSALAVQPVRG